MKKSPRDISRSFSASQLFQDALAHFSPFNHHLFLPPLPPTMSPRRQSSRVTKMDVDYKEYDDTGPSEEEAVSVPAKRRKIADSAPKKPTKRRKGRLSRLPDMPLDVLYEVISPQHGSNRKS